MPYDRLRERLEEGPGSPTLTALPDGSVDRYCDVEVGIGADVAAATALGELIAEGTVGSFRVRPHTDRAGGQGVNLASGARALGAEVTLYGHLDHPIHADHPFETVSMGDPAEVFVLEFEGDALFVANDPEDTETWGFDDLAAAAEGAGRDLDRDLTADGVAILNWVSFPGMASAVGVIADRAAEAGGDGDTPLLLDVGDVGGSDPESLGELIDGIGSLAGPYDAMFSGNETEVRVLGEAAGAEGDGDDPIDRLRAIHGATGAAAVLHGKEGAVAVVDGEVHRRASPAVEEPERSTGGGDTFGAGLLHARARGWEWERSLELANAVTARYVERGEHATPAELAAYLGEAELAEFEDA